ncbi:hypothetical protein [Alkalimarinus alittae]|uniref:Uncharacterized protein n=1 Tax=Alkalimarinus alittae TaxID=2961619 RepID=A0ABY6N753_9ALTE|nr:hypothetical protein [Alkalimarinus alittae]UZE97807.1 hypothetical protein NKI27_08765 [Alkalimarinus alittae]
MKPLVSELLFDGRWRQRYRIAEKCIVTVLLVSFSMGTQAKGNEDTSGFEGISVTGSNELPQVLYIIPWQPPAYQKRAQHPPKTELSGIIKPIEPAFHNEDYHFRKKLEVKVQALNGRK